MIKWIKRVFNIPITNHTLAARVERGIRLLNNTEPQWIWKIDLDTLVMMDAQNCILGQLYGHYRSDKAFTMIGDDIDIAEYGLSLPQGNVTLDYDYNWGQLHDQWAKRIRELRNQQNDVYR